MAIRTQEGLPASAYYSGIRAIFNPEFEHHLERPTFVASLDAIIDHDALFNPGETRLIRVRAPQNYLDILNHLPEDQIRAGRISGRSRLGQPGGAPELIYENNLWKSFFLDEVTEELKFYLPYTNHSSRKLSLLDGDGIGRNIIWGEPYTGENLTNRIINNFSNPDEIGTGKIGIKGKLGRDYQIHYQKDKNGNEVAVGIEFALSQGSKMWLPPNDEIFRVDFDCEIAEWRTTLKSMLVGIDQAIMHAQNIEPSRTTNSYLEIAESTIQLTLKDGVIARLSPQVGYRDEKTGKLYILPLSQARQIGSIAFYPGETPDWEIVVEQEISESLIRHGITPNTGIMLFYPMAKTK